MTGPVTRAVTAMRNDQPARRSLLVGLATLPLASSATIAAPSDLATACLWSVQHKTWLSSVASGPEWNDATLEVEMLKDDAIFQRAINEPSISLADLNAKARLALQDYEDGLFAFRDEAENAKVEAELSDDERLIRVVLREVIALTAI